MASVWYVGTSHERTISSVTWNSSTGSTRPKSVWNVDNGWSLPHSDFNSAQLELLANIDGFLVGQADGPRPYPRPAGNPTAAEGDKSAYVYYKAIYDLMGSLMELGLDDAESVAELISLASTKADKTYVNAAIRPGGYIPNCYYYCDSSKSVLNAFSADRLRLIPFIVTHPVPVSHLFIDVTTAAAGSNVLATIYDDDGNGKPLNRKCWATISTATTGIIESSVGTPATLQPGLHWGGGIMRGANVPTLRAVVDPLLGIQIPSPGNPGVLPTSGDAPISWALATVSGDPPAVLGSGLFTANAAVPRIGYRVAA